MENRQPQTVLGLAESETSRAWGVILQDVVLQVSLHSL